VLKKRIDNAMKRILIVYLLSISLDIHAVTLSEVIESVKPLPSVTGNDISNVIAKKTEAQAQESKTGTSTTKISKKQDNSSLGNKNNSSSGNNNSSSGNTSNQDFVSTSNFNNDNGYVPPQAPEIPSGTNSNYLPRTITFTTGNISQVDAITSRIINFTLEKNPTVSYGCWTVHTSDGSDQNCGHITTSYTSHYVIAGGPQYAPDGTLLYSSYIPMSDRDLLISIMRLVPPSNTWTDQMRGWAADGVCFVFGFCESPPAEAIAQFTFQKEIGGIPLEVIPSPPVARQVITLAGSSIMPSPIDGDTLKTKFGQVKGMTFFDRNAIYFADVCSIRKIIPSDKITFKTSGKAPSITNTTEHDLNLTTYTIAGSPTSCSNLDGSSSTARFSMLSGMTKHGTDIVVADGSAIRKVTTNGTTTTIAGMVDQPGYVDAQAKNARFSMIGGIASDGNTIYVSDKMNNAIRILKSDGTVGTLVGNPDNSGYVDGAQANARFDNPTHIVTNGKILIVWDSNNHTLRRINIATGETSTLAGHPNSTSIVDGIGTQAELFNVTALYLYGNTLFIADEGRIRRMDITKGDVKTIAGNGNNKKKDDIGISAGFMDITAMLCDGYDLYVFDNHSFRVLKDALK